MPEPSPAGAMHHTSIALRAEVVDRLDALLVRVRRAGGPSYRTLTRAELIEALLSAAGDDPRQALDAIAALRANLGPRPSRGARRGVPRSRHIPSTAAR